MQLPEPDNRWPTIVRRAGEVNVLTALHGELPLTVELGGPSQTLPGTLLHTAPVGPAGPVGTIGVTSSQVRAMLDGFLAHGLLVQSTLSWEARGFGKLRRDTIHVRPR